MINPNAYYTVQGWMLSELGLKGNALAVYAIIYGFSQDGISEYAGSSRYLCEWLGCSKKTVLSALAYLTEQGYLRKKTEYKNGVTFCNYMAVRPPKTDTQEGGVKITPPGEILHQGGEEITPGAVKNLHQGGEEITPHNNRDNNIYNSNINNAQKEETEPPEPPKPPKITAAEIDQFFDLIWTLYPVKKGKGKVSESKRRELHKIGFEEIKRAIQRYLKDLEKDAEWRHPQHGSTFFNSGYIDYLDKNYTPPAAPAQPARPAARGGHAGPVGPNGIPIDPGKTDLDAYLI